MRSQGPLAAELDVDVAFHDTDLMQVVWHGHYLKYLENARWKLMERIGFGYAAMAAAGYAWPIVDLHVRYVRMARFGDRLRVRASLVEWESRVVLHYLVTDATTGDRVARARTTQVAVDGATGAMQFVLPAAFTARVEATLAGARAAP